MAELKTKTDIFVLITRSTPDFWRKRFISMLLLFSSDHSGENFFFVCVCEYSMFCVIRESNGVLRNILWTKFFFKD